MDRDALRRAYRALGADPKTQALLHTLAALQALLALSFGLILSLLLALASTRGITRIDPQPLGPESPSSIPTWLRDRLPIPDPSSPPSAAPTLLPDTGLYPLVPSGLDSPNPIHRALAHGLNLALSLLRPLRDNRSALVALVMLGLLVLLAWYVVARARRRLTIAAVTTATEGVRGQLHRQMYRLGQSYLPAEGIGPVLNIFTRDVNELRDGLLVDLLHRVYSPVLAAGLLLLALAVSPSLTAFCLSLGVLVAYGIDRLSQIRRQQATTAARASAIHLLQLHEDLSMLRTVRVFGMEPIDTRRFEEHLTLFHQAERRRLDDEGPAHPATRLMIGAGVLLIAAMLTHAVLSSRTSLHGALILAASLAALIWPIRRWVERHNALQAASRAAASIEDYLDRRPELQMTVDARFLQPIRDQISFEHVSLDGPGGQPLLSQVSFSIPARARTSILSLDEDARHAVACLIPRLIDPKSGHVRIDGVDLREVTFESLRAQVALLLQADYVFSDSVINNIGLGDPSYGLPRIIEAAKAAHAHHFIQQLPQGYDTVIGPLGFTLTLEDQYRIALARAFLHDPSIVIIEEPDTTLDDDIKHLIDDAIDRLAKGRTLIFLPHRLSTIRRCDHVVVLHNGKVEASGPPREVHGQSKLYRHIQYLEFNRFATGDVEPSPSGSV
ncbi:MAG: hypothetical protein KatS3mg108_3058 [Isosphaeraceae bacterium]|jgi:ABC-type multidrug transport system fused ATPase/permease subunit|nr:MAG: hypothetical protein KatS3mg108_3058 [Isosphaeraceae bacterium]